MKTVQSCLATCHDLDYEIVVADDASDDDSPAAVREWCPQARIVGHSQRRGVSPTKDLGARHARGDVLVFLDGHCKPEPGAIARLTADVLELDAQAIVTPRVPALEPVRWSNSYQQVGYGYFVDLRTFQCGWIPLRNLKRWERYYRTPALIGCCFAVSRRLYWKLWGFDVEMQSWGCEDLDFGLKAQLLGHPLLHDPQAAIGHRFRSSFDNYWVPQEHLLANELRMARKLFGDETWYDWRQRWRERNDSHACDRAWSIFNQRRDSVEHERAYLFAHRLHDEYWFAEEFSLDWPVRGALRTDSDPGVSPESLLPAEESRLHDAFQMKASEADKHAPLGRSRFPTPAERFREHLRAPRNRGTLPTPCLVGRSAAAGKTIALFLRPARAADGMVYLERAAFDYDGQDDTLAYLSVLTEILQHQPLSEVRRLTPEYLAAVFQTNGESLKTAAPVIDALRAALTTFF